MNENIQKIQTLCKKHPCFSCLVSPVCAYTIEGTREIFIQSECEEIKLWWRGTRIK